MIPGETPCYNCAFETRSKNLRPIRRRKTTLAYTMELGEAKADRFESEPGLGIDIDYITLAAMPYALALLDLKSKRRFLLDLNRNLVFLSTGTQPSWIFDRPFTRIIGQPEMGCDTCRYLLTSTRRSKSD